MAQDNYRFTLQEFSGSLADLGGMAPFIIGAVAISNLHLGPILLFFGIAHFMTGAYYKIPMSVQPMKAIGALVIAEELTHGELIGAGVAIGLIFLILGLTGSIRHLAEIIPRSVVRGTQLGMGLIIIVKASKFIFNDITVGVMALALVAVFIIAKKEQFSALLILGIGLVYGFYTSTSGAIPGIGLGQYFSLNISIIEGLTLPGFDDLVSGTLKGAIAQLPLTFANAILATSLIVNDLYKRDITPKKLAISTGIMNLISAPFGGLPMCHGSSGIAAHYRFGARTGGANMMLGVLLVITAFIASSELLTLIPFGVMGTLLLFAGFELGKSSLKTDSMFVTAFIGVLSLVSNIAVGFAGGLVLVFVLDRVVCLRRGVTS